MQENETMMSANRAELIKIARESCAKNLYSNNSRNNQSSNKRLTSVRRDSLDGATMLIPIARRSSVSNTDTRLNGIRFFAIRMIIAVILFASVVLIDQTKFTYNKFNSSVIEEAIHTNASAKRAVDIVATFTQDKILKVIQKK
ncbi:hypothetical protein [Anaeromicropila herbilytica]|uniref:Uncharacterized protein n=1 Tax=Anaeromicropila herbilytica TaxID=2785025 RepID=A0A7R7EL01_9FIRM|nr:hypothetical protein [Anaeromicropila herbilytica]BCN30689.1 hypothetical protein bsdtb5_19840 [Anaeromicropila herbilytica]